MAWTIPWNIIGLQVSGDVGDLTIYTDRFGRKVPFPRSPPKQPPSIAQVQRRNQFRQAVQSYMMQTEQVKQQWEDITKKLSLPLTGQNLWISASFSQDSFALQTLNKQANTSVEMPPSVQLV